MRNHLCLRFPRVFVGLLVLGSFGPLQGFAEPANLLHVSRRFAQLQPAKTKPPASESQEQKEGETQSATAPAPTGEHWLDQIKLSSRWSFAFGVGVISDTSVNDYFTLGYKHLNGPGSGLTYNLTVAYRLREFDWQIWGTRVRPHLELPFMLTLVDEDDNDLFPDYNLGLKFRWRDFPWNRFVDTTFAVGGGLSYSAKIWTADRERHRGDDRSNLKYWLPIELTLALPRYPKHQLMLFIDHQSGGWMFDKGGVDAWGAGYRIQF